MLQWMRRVILVGWVAGFSAMASRSYAGAHMSKTERAHEHAGKIQIHKNNQRLHEAKANATSNRTEHLKHKVAGKFAGLRANHETARAGAALKGKLQKPRHEFARQRAATQAHAARVNEPPARPMGRDSF